MHIIDYGIVLIIALIAGLIIFYIRKQKKSGKKCVGCPYASSCGGCCTDQKNK